MKEIKEKTPLIQTGKKYWEASRLRITLKNYYNKKRRYYAEDFPDFHDSNLKKIFSPPVQVDQPAPKKLKDSPLAADIIRKHKKDILGNVAHWTGERKYMIGDLLDTITQRCRELRLRTQEAEPLVMLKVSTYVTTLVMNYLYTGRFGRKNG